MEDVTITRHDHGDHGEYHAHVAGVAEFGRLTWRQRNGARDAEHTLVPKAIGGRGVAGELVRALVADAREQGFRIIPTCSYVHAAFDRYPEWADLLAHG